MKFVKELETVRIAASMKITQMPENDQRYSFESKCGYIPTYKKQTLEKIDISMWREDHAEKNVASHDSWGCMEENDEKAGWERMI